MQADKFLFTFYVRTIGTFPILKRAYVKKLLANALNKDTALCKVRFGFDLKKQWV